MTEFKTKISITIDGEEQGKAMVRWTYDPEMREWGIKGFGVAVPEQTIETSYTVYVESKDEDEPREATHLVKGASVVYMEKYSHQSRDIMRPSGLERHKGRWHLFF